MSTQNNSTVDISESITTGLRNTSMSNAPSAILPEDSNINVVETEVKPFVTTKFIDDADTVQRDESNVDHMDPMILTSNDTQMFEQQIIDFLKKPIVLTNGNFNITDDYTFFNYFSLPYAVLTSTAGELWLSKLKGFFGMRCDMRLRIVTNANRFQQGRYIMGWVPMGGSALTTSSLKNVKFNNMHMATLVQRTTVPHVEIDLATQTSAELLIPFASTQLFWPINSAISASDYSALGYLSIYPYSPLVAPTGSTTASYTVYISLENIKLFGAASPQADIGKREISNKMNGPISGTAMAISKGFNEFSRIPLLSEYALGVSWISDRIAKVASIFGFSKPTQGDSQTKFQINNVPAHTTIDGDSDVKSLSFLSKPGTVPIKGHSGTAFDEMDFSYILRKYAYFTQFTMTTSTAIGNFATITVKSDKYVQFGSIISFTPIGMMTAMFSFWRGSIKFRFKIVKTEFHSGRIAVSFFPTDENSYTSLAQYVNRQIIDIRDVVDFEVIVPYISRTPWLKYGQQFGILSIDVVDQLVAPSSVSNTITFLVEVAGGDDFEVAGTTKFDWTPVYAVPQGAAEEGTGKNLSFTIGNSNVVGNPINATAFCIGDKITNMRAFLKRYTPILPNSKITASTSRVNGINAIVVPDMIIALDNSTATYYQLADMVSVVGSWYCFWSGGVRIRDIYDYNVTTTPGNSSFASLMSAQIQVSTAAQVTPVTSTNTRITAEANLNLAIHACHINNAISVEIPQYTRNLCRTMVDCFSWQSDSAPTTAKYSASASNTQYLLYLATSVYEGAGQASIQDYDMHNVYRALADDGNFSLFISIPPVINTGSPGSVGFY